MPLDGASYASGARLGSYPPATITTPGLSARNHANQPQRGPALERHHGEPDDVWLPVTYQPLDGGDDAILDEDQVGDGYLMAGRPRCRRATPAHHSACAWSAQGVLERVWHREQQHSHGGSPVGSDSVCGLVVDDEGHHHVDLVIHNLSLFTPHVLFLDPGAANMPDGLRRPSQPLCNGVLEALR